MKNLKIGVRLGLGFAAVLLLLVVLTVIGVVRMHTASAMTEVLVNVKVKNERQVSEWVKIIEVNAVRASAAFKVTDPAEQKGFEKLMASSSARATEIQDQLASTLQEPRARALYQEILTSRKAYTDTRKAVLAAKSAGEMDRARQLFDGDMGRLRDIYLGKLAELATLQKKLLDDTAGDIASQYASGRTLLVTLGVLAVIIGIFCAMWISRSITGPINAAVKVAETVAGGDLSAHIDSDSSDETGQLMRALKRMNDSLVSIVGQVRSGTDTIATASKEIAAGNLDLSSRTEQQASSLEETASSMEELTSTVRQNVDNARQANKLAQDAADIAGRGGAVVADVVSTMGSINDSSRKIVDIISVIDGIAFQTNILALNAAVEAARAGEQGRGFAVVATEVRNLAHRSAAAAKEIKGLIDDSVEKVEAGTSLVDKAGRTMDEIVQSIGFVTGIMNEISHASGEQSAGIEQVNEAITEMDAVTQQNAALVEQASAAAEAMQEQASHLAVLVGQFKLDARDTARAAITAQLSQTATARPAHVVPARKPGDKSTLKSPLKSTPKPPLNTAFKATLKSGARPPHAPAAEVQLASVTEDDAPVVAASRPVRPAAARPAATATAARATASAPDEWEEF